MQAGSCRRPEFHLPGLERPNTNLRNKLKQLTAIVVGILITYFAKVFWRLENRVVKKSLGLASVRCCLSCEALWLENQLWARHLLQRLPLLHHEVLRQNWSGGRGFYKIHRSRRKEQYLLIELRWFPQGTATKTAVHTTNHAATLLQNNDLLGGTSFPATPCSSTPFSAKLIEQKLCTTTICSTRK